MSVTNKILIEKGKTEGQNYYLLLLLLGHYFWQWEKVNNFG